MHYLCGFSWQTKWQQLLPQALENEVDRLIGFASVLPSNASFMYYFWICLQGQKEAQKNSIMLSCSPIRSLGVLHTASWHDQPSISGSCVAVLSSPDLYTGPEY